MSHMGVQLAPCALLAALFIAVAVPHVHATHFRGGIITCGPVLGNTTDGGFTSSGEIEVECLFRIGWRRDFDYNSVAYCNRTTIETRSMVVGPNIDGLLCKKGCYWQDEYINYLSFFCTEYSEEENWSQGSNTFRHTFQAISPEVELRVDSCCWISTLAKGSDGNIQWGTTLSLARRADTNRMNFSPRSAQLPIAVVQENCNTTLPVHTDDPDGDEVRCRWATGDECGGVCSAVPGATLTANPCQLHLSNNMTAGLYAVALTLEDFQKNNPKRLSSVPLQFLINVTSSLTSCNARPVLISPSPTDGKCIAIPPGSTYKAVLRAELETLHEQITDFRVVAPVGMQKSALQTKATSATRKQAEVTMTWKPRRDQYGQNIFCFEGRDSSGKSSAQRCLTLLAGAAPPELNSSSITPSPGDGSVPHLYASFQVAFNQQVFKPSASAMIRFFEHMDNNTFVEALAIDSSSSPDVKIREHPTQAGQFLLTFVNSRHLRVGARYSIKLDAGTVVGALSCTGGGAPYPGLTDMAVWQFTTNSKVGNISKCSSSFAQTLEYGAAKGHQKIALGNGSACHTVQFGLEAKGFPMHQKTHQTATLCENGLILLDKTTTIRYPQTFPASWSAQPTVFGAYWCLADNSYSKGLPENLRSNVWYRVLTNGPGKRISRSDFQTVVAVDSLISAKYHSSSSYNFRTRWALIVTWQRITPYPSIYKYQVHNTFQAVLATDGYRSYAMYLYDSDAIQWSVPTIRDPRAKYGHAVMGYTSPGYHYTDSRSSSLSISRIDTIVDQRNAYLLQQVCPSGALYIFQLYDQNTIDGSRAQCLKWYSQQPEHQIWSADLIPCPPLLSQAESDSRFRTTSRKAPQLCFHNVVPTPQGAVQECCYRRSNPGYGALLLGQPDGGNAVRFSDLVHDPETYSAQEVLPHKQCCVQENLCSKFYSKRPSGTSNNYVKPQIASVFGGEYLTFDGQRFTYNCPGQYQLTDVTQNSASGWFQFSAQILVDASLITKNATFPQSRVTSFAMNSSHTSTVQVSVNESQSLFILVDGKNLTDLVTHLYTDDGENVTVICLLWGVSCRRRSSRDAAANPAPYGVYSRGNLTIIVINSTSCKLVLALGITVDISVLTSTGGLSISVAIPISFRADRSATSVTGLLGNFDGNSSNEFYYRDGISGRIHTLPVPLTTHNAFYYYCRQWLLVNSRSSIFIYPVGRSSLYYTQAAVSFWKRFYDVENYSFRADHVFSNACGNNPTCIAMATSSGRKDVVDDFWKFFTDEENLQYNVGTVYSAQFVTYDGQTYTYNCPGEFILSNVAVSGFTFSAQVLVDEYRAVGTAVQRTGISALALTCSYSTSIQLEATTTNAMKILVNRVDVTSIVLQLANGKLTSLQDCLKWGISCVRGTDQPFSKALPPGINSSTNISIVVYSASWCKVIYASGVVVDITLHLDLSSLSVSVSVPRKYQGQAISGLLGNCDGDTRNEFLWNGEKLPLPLSLSDAFNQWCRQWVPKTAPVFVYAAGKSRSFYTKVQVSYTLWTWSSFSSSDAVRYRSTCGTNFACAVVACTTSASVSSAFLQFFTRRSYAVGARGSTYGSQFVSYDGTTYSYSCPGQYSLTSIKTTAYSFQSYVLVDLLPSVYGPVKTAGVSGIVFQPSDCPLIQVGVGTSSSFAVYVNRVDISVRISRLFEVTISQPEGGVPFVYNGIRCIRAASVSSLDELYRIQSQNVATIVFISRVSCQVYFRSGISVSIVIRTGTSSLSISNHVPYTFRGTAVTGLFGDYNGSPLNDLHLPTGLQVRNTPYRVFSQFASYWRSTSTSVCVYRKGTNYTYYYNLSVKHIFLDWPAISVPLDLIFPITCLHRITCSAEYFTDGGGKRFLEFVDAITGPPREQSYLDTTPPVCTGPLRLSISFAGEATGTLQVSYTYLHLLTFAVIPPVPAGFEFLDLHGRYRWKLQRNAPIVNLRISVTAPDGSCTIHQPEVFVCDCSNKGTCDFNKTTANLQSRVKVATCLCPEAYSGQYCEEDRDACKAAFQPCFSGVDCIDRTAPQIGYACGGCPMGFNGSGDSCYDIDECAKSSVCPQDCINTQGSYQCTCNTGYELSATDNRTCHDIDECATRQHDCQQTCSNVEGNYTCSCTAGYLLGSDGKSCNAKKVCDKTTKCQQLCCLQSGAEVCSCRNGYTLQADKQTCQDVDECSSSSLCASGCNNTAGSFHCTCSRGFELQADRRSCKDLDECSTVLFSTCHGGQKCINTLGSFLCQCEKGYTYNTSSLLCEAVSCGSPPAVNNSVVTGDDWTYQQSIQYSCETGYTLAGNSILNCQANSKWLGLVPKCNIRNCPRLSLASNLQVGGYAGHASFRDVVNFQCNLGYTLNGSSSSLCLADGTWSSPVPVCNVLHCPSLQVPSNGRLNATGGTVGDVVGLACNAGFGSNTTMARCEGDGTWTSSQLQCHDINECNSSPCKHGSCLDQLAKYVCICSPGYTGILCETDINECIPSPCQNGGSCSDLINSYSCSCVAGYTGRDCETNIDECQTAPCQNGGSCIDGINNYTCACPHGFYDRHCTAKTDECHPNPCENSGTCNDLHLDYNCVCAAGWTGKNCSVNINECASSPCKHGSCVDAVNGYQCICTAGYTGVVCETDIAECASEACQHGSTCIDGIASFSCRCVAGYSGTLCETDINECSPSPCQNGGSCSDLINSYSCSCVAGYTGRDCETNIDECQTAPCQNGGSCIDGINNYTCACPHGFYDRHCTAKTDECHPNPCENSGTCNDLHLDYNCVCAAGWTGKNCSVNINECASSPCKHGSCVDAVNGYQCICTAGYTGVVCETDIAECASEACQHGSTCIDGIASFSCRCVAGYTGTLCETDINECSPSPCQNGGSCSDLINSYSCSCVAGYTGRDCETNIDECQSAPCQNGGSCIDGINNYTCACPHGFYDRHCTAKTDECHPNPCENSGTCNDLHLDYNCVCAAGWTGKNCSVNINECASSPCKHGSCVDAVNGYQCICAAGYTGVVCETDIAECASEACQHGSTCIDGIASFSCRCVAGYSGTLCETDINECSPSPCQNGGSCSDLINSYSCRCVAGYTGRDCETNIDECQTAPCQNGGSCIDGINNYTCACPHGFYDRHCTAKTDECHPNPCENSGTCNDLHLDYNCVCAAGWTGKNCSVNINECASSPCKHGSCVDAVNGYQCICTAGYTGVVCETDIAECASEACQHGSTCIDGIASFSCRCVAGYTGTLCETDINECSPSPCQNGGSCSDLINSYSCSCVAGYTGRDCETNIDECQSAPCQNGGSCIDGINNYTCACPHGFYDRHCTAKTDECHPNPCENSGTCNDLHLDYNCVCAAGWTGKNCSVNINECASSPCKHGSCVDAVNGYQCICTAGYTGVVCETDIAECASEACQHGSTCIDGIASFSCRCVAGYTGTLCETDINECSPSPCQNGGSCSDLINSYSCRCVAGYTGRDCETNIDECQTAPCQNGGSCIDGINNYTCACPHGFYDRHCTAKTDECHPNPCENSGTCNDLHLNYNCVCAAGWTGKNCSVNINECASSPCKHGSCVDAVNGYQCICTAGYTGVVCETDIAECASEACQHGSTCIDGIASFSCRCVAGYTGTLCETDINECSPSPCQNGGSCSDLINSYSCSCVAGYTGRDCETNIDECQTAPCQNGGSCIDGINNYTCACPHGFYDRHCTAKTDECHPNPCENSGTCNDLHLDYNCVCVAGWRGKNCSVNINECASSPCKHGSCVDAVNGYQCICTAGYTGVVCETDIAECASEACQHGSTCIDGIASFSCRCVAGYSGTLCETDINECSPSPCQNGGSCSDLINSYSCRCVAGYTGRDCETNIDECQSAPCQNGGSCIDGINNYTCACPHGFYDRHCTAKTDECHPNPCENSGTCNDLHLDYNCVCAAGWTGKNCSVNINECASSPCKHGSCVDAVNGYQCICAAGYTGVVCETDIAECASEACQHGSTCIDGIASFSCRCVAGYSGTLCETDINECSPSPCQNGGSCSDLINSYSCRCVAGYTGRDCETNIDECQTAPCQNGGSCIDGINNYTCACPHGFYDRHCTAKTDECHPNPCENSGTCNDLHLDYNCVCAAGWTGKNCSVNINECASSPCKHGSCVDAVNGYQCICTAGYTGVVCETDIAECASEACQHGSTCIDGIASFSCRCVAGYSGTLCETDINECSPSPCQNGGSCSDLINSYSCSCVAGYTGRDCETNIDECQSAPCQNGGSCIDVTAGYICQCMLGFTGRQCQTNIDECQSSPCNNGSCNDLVNGYNCSCHAGYAGNACEENFDECASSPCLHGTCIDHVNQYKCTCIPGYHGDNCDLAKSCTVRTGNPLLKLSGNSFVFNETIAFSCTPGYSLLGSMTLHCLSTGRWSGSWPRCVKGCPVVKAPANGLVVGGQSVKERQIGSSLTFSCHTGFALTKPATAKCLDSARWSVSGQTCQPLQCPRPISENGKLKPSMSVYNYSDSVSLTCDDGFIANRTVFKQTVRCTEDGSWNASIVGCQDLNECLNRANFPCEGEHVACSNTVGHYKCTCLTGYSKQQGTCKDYNECKVTPQVCNSETSTCKDLVGRYECNCKEGYKSDGISCYALQDNNPGEEEKAQKSSVKFGFSGNIEPKTPSSSTLSNNQWLVVVSIKAVLAARLNIFCGKNPKACNLPEDVAAVLQKMLQDGKPSTEMQTITTASPGTGGVAESTPANTEGIPKTFQQASTNSKVATTSQQSSEDGGQTVTTSEPLAPSTEPGGVKGFTKDSIVLLPSSPILQGGSADVEIYALLPVGANPATNQGSEGDTAGVVGGLVPLVPLEVLANVSTAAKVEIQEKLPPTIVLSTITPQAQVNNPSQPEASSGALAAVGGGMGALVVIVLVVVAIVFIKKYLTKTRSSMSLRPVSPEGQPSGTFARNLPDENLFKDGYPLDEYPVGSGGCKDASNSTQVSRCGRNAQIEQHPSRKDSGEYAPVGFGNWCDTPLDSENSRDPCATSKTGVARTMLRQMSSKVSAVLRKVSTGSRNSYQVISDLDEDYEDMAEQHSTSNRTASKARHMRRTDSSYTAMECLPEANNGAHLDGMLQEYEEMEEQHSKARSKTTSDEGGMRRMNSSYTVMNPVQQTTIGKESLQGVPEEYEQMADLPGISCGNTIDAIRPQAGTHMVMKSSPLQHIYDNPKAIGTVDSLLDTQASRRKSRPATNDYVIAPSRSNNSTVSPGARRSSAATNSSWIPDILPQPGAIDRQRLHDSPCVSANAGSSLDFRKKSSDAVHEYEEIQRHYESPAAITRPDSGTGGKQVSRARRKNGAVQIGKTE